MLFLTHNRSMYYSFTSYLPHRGKLRVATATLGKTFGSMAANPQHQSLRPPQTTQEICQEHFQMEASGQKTYQHIKSTEKLCP